MIVSNAVTTGYSTRLNFTQPAVTNLGVTYSGALTLQDDEPAVNGAYSAVAGDTFYIVRTDGHLWPSSGSKGQLFDGIMNGTVPSIAVGAGIVTNALTLNSDIVTGTSGFLRVWFGNATPQGSGAWKNGTGTNNWSANTAVDSGWGGTSGTVPGGTNNGTGFGKPGDAGHIATFNNSVLNYAGGLVNQDVTGLIIGGLHLSDSGSGGYTIGTGAPGGATAKAVTLDDGSLRSAVKVNSGVHTINSPLTVIGAGVAVTTTNATDKVTFNGDITATGTSSFVAGTNNKTLTKGGVGTMVLAGTNAFSGGTTISGGAVEVSGSLSGTVSVNAGGTLAGAGGTTSSLLTVNGGTFSPGASGADSTTAGVSALGTFNATGGVSIATGSTFKLDLQAASTGGFDNGTNDKLNVTGAISVTGTTTIVLTMTGGYIPVGGDLFFIALNDGSDAITGTAANFNVLDAGGFSWTLTTFANAGTGSFTGGNDIALMAVPEPNSIAMLMGSLGMALGLQRFRRRSSKSLS